MAKIVLQPTIPHSISGVPHNVTMLFYRTQEPSEMVNWTSFRLLWEAEMQMELTAATHLYVQQQFKRTCNSQIRSLFRC